MLFSANCFTRSLFSISLLALTGLIACDKTTNTGDREIEAPTPLPLDAILGDGEVRCGRITRERELIGGDGAFGQIGDYRCMNRNIRFIVQGFENPIGLSAGGGTLIDVDLVRNEDERGEDTFRELIIAFGVNEVDVDTIEIINDGRDGQPAVLRVSGVPSPISVAPQVSILAQKIMGRLQTDYILRPDAHFIEVKTTFFNEGDDQIYGLLIADAVVFGAASPSFTPTSGFIFAPPFAEVPFIGMGGNRKVSYAYVCAPEDDVTLPFDARGVKVAFCKDDTIVAKKTSYSRFILVGDGTIESLVSTASEHRKTLMHQVQGSVTMSTGDLATDTSVYLLQGEGEERHAVNQTFVQDDGSFSLQAAPGEYEITAHRPRGASSPSQIISVSDDTDVGNLVLSEVARLIVQTDFTSRDSNALPQLPARLTLIPTETEPLVDRALGDWEKEGSQVIEVSTDGNFDLDSVPVGSYELYISRGFEFTRHQESIVLTLGQTTTIEAHLVHVLNTDGLVATEFHQHTIGGTDSKVPMELRVLENAAEGIEFAASTEHDVVLDFKPYVEKWGIQDALTVVAGSEVSYSSLGHFNIYPFDLSIQPAIQSGGVDVWWQKTIPELFDNLREMAGDPIVQINHPRDGVNAFFTNMRLDPTDATRFERGESTLPTLPSNIYQEWPSVFDAIEVNGDIGQPEEFLPEADADFKNRAEKSPGTIAVLHDYFALLGSGMPVTALANSDSHAFFEGAGYPRSFVASSETGGNLDEEIIKDSIRKQYAMAGQGCLIELLVDGERVMGKQDAISASALANLSIRVQAPPHIVVETLEFYINGRAQFLQTEEDAIKIAPNGELRLPTSTFAQNDVVQTLAFISGLPSDKDLVLVALARGDEGLRPTGGGATYCYTAPLYVDANEDGWTGWLKDSQKLYRQ